MRISDWSSDVCSSDLIGQSDDAAFETHDYLSPFSFSLFADGFCFASAFGGSGFSARCTRLAKLLKRPSPRRGASATIVSRSGSTHFISVLLKSPSTALNTLSLAPGWPMPMRTRRKFSPIRSEEHTSELQSLMRHS